MDPGLGIPLLLMRDSGGGDCNGPSTFFWGGLQSGVRNLLNIG